MRNLLIDLSELSDSRELLEAKAPKVITIFIYFILVIFIIGILWMAFFSIEITVKAQGVMKTVEDRSIGRCIVSGNITELLFKDGDQINEGDLLYKIDATSYEIEYETVATTLELNENKIYNIKLLQESITKGECLFISNNIEFFNRYITYKVEKEKLYLSYIQAERDVEKERNLPLSMQVPLNLEVSQHNSSYLLLCYEAYISQTQVQLSSELNLLEEEKIQLESRKLLLEQQLNQFIVTAPISGIIQKAQAINPGDYILAGSEIFIIVPVNETSLKVNIMVSNKDIAGIRVGDSVTYRFPALPQNEYGIFEGIITNIPEDISSSNQADGVYVLQGSLNKSNFSSNLSAPLKAGMFCNVRIIAREQKIILFLLEKLDLRQ